MYRLVLLMMFAATACNAYDPDLGDQPFRCGMAEPRCPDGFGCVVRGPGDAYCERGIDSVDASALVDCTSDLREPNDQIVTATGMSIPANLLQMSICPDGDIDVYRFSVASTMNARVDVRHSTARGVLQLDVLNIDGVSFSSGVQVAEPDVVRAEVAELRQGTYYVQVRAPAGVQNNYDLELSVTATP